MDRYTPNTASEIETRRQLRIFKTMIQRIQEQERLVRMIEQESVIPEMAQDLAKKGNI